MAFNYTLGVVVEDVKRIADTIQRMERSMHHATPGAVDVLRRNKAQLEAVIEFIMNLDVQSKVSLQSLLTAHKECLQECIDASYSEKKPYIGRTRII